MTGSPFEEGVEAGRRATHDGAYASGLAYGLLTRHAGVTSPPTLSVDEVRRMVQSVPPPAPRPPRKLRPAHEAALKAIRATGGPVLLDDVAVAIGAAGYPLAREGVRSVLNELHRRGLVRRVAALGRTSNRPAWAWEAP